MPTSPRKTRKSSRAGADQFELGTLSRLHDPGERSQSAGGSHAPAQLHVRSRDRSSCELSARSLTSAAKSKAPGCSRPRKATTPRAFSPRALQVIGQIPFGRFTPFAIFGGGAIGAGSSTMGTDTDPAIHFGLGAKYALSEGFGLRLDLRDTMHQQNRAPQDTLTHSFEVLLSLTFALHMRHEQGQTVAGARRFGRRRLRRFERQVPESGRHRAGRLSRQGHATATRFSTRRTRVPPKPARPRAAAAA